MKTLRAYSFVLLLVTYFALGEQQPLSAEQCSAWFGNDCDCAYGSNDDAAVYCSGYSCENENFCLNVESACYAMCSGGYGSWSCGSSGFDCWGNCYCTWT